MTILDPAAHAIIFCNSCGALSIDTPAFGWKRYRARDIDITICHHCPTCQEYSELARAGLVHGVEPKDVPVYIDWELTR